MSIPSQVIDIPLTGGLDTKLDSVLPDKSRLLALSNASFNKNGTLERRDAWTSLAGTGGINPIELATLGNELLAVDSNTGNLFSYSSTAGSLISRGSPARFSLSRMSIVRDAGTQQLPDCAHQNGFTCHVWRNSTVGGTYTYGYSVVDEATGVFIVKSGSLGASASSGVSPPRVIASGDGVHFLVSYVRNDNNLYVLSIVASTGTIVSGPAILSTNGRTVIDMCPAGPSYALVVFLDGSTNVSALLFSPTAAQVGTTVSAIAGAKFSGLCKSIAVVPFSSSSFALVCADDGSSNVVTAILSYSANAISVSIPAAKVSVAASSIFVTMALEPTGLMRVFSCPAASAGNIVNWDVFTLSSSGYSTTPTHPLAVISTSNSVFQGPFLAGKAFVSSAATTATVPIRMLGTLQSSVYLSDASGNILASALYGQAGSYNANGGAVPSCPVVASGTNAGATLIPAQRQGQLSFTDGINTTQTGISAIYLQPGRTTSKNSLTPMWHAQSANCLFFSGSFMSMYDGKQVAEAGFFYFPEGVGVTNTGVGTVSGTFQVVALYEWVDGQGQRHQSAPSAAATLTLGSNASITMTAPTLQLGTRASNCAVVFYRTVAAGTTFYRINSPTSPIANTPTTAIVTYVDTTPTTLAASDPITANEILYTTSGALPNDNPPACNAIASFQGRIVYSNAEDPQDWRFSQPPVVGQGLYFNELLLGQRTPQDAGTINALATLDDKLIIATPAKKLFVVGQGPDTTGNNGTYQAPQLLPSDVGCIDQRSLCLVPDSDLVSGGSAIQTPGGLIHQTKHGLYLLTRALVDQYIGEPVAAYAEGGAAISSGVLLQDRAQARFTAPGGVVLVYDYLFGQWATFSSGSYSPASGCVWNGTWTSASAGTGAPVGTLTAALGITGSGPSSALIQDSPGTYLDGGISVIPVSFTTAWMKLAGLQGFQRLRRVLLFGAWGGPSTLTATAQHNYSSQAPVGEVTGILGVTSDPLGSLSESTTSLTTTDGQRWQVRWHQAVQKCESAQFTVTDTPAAGSSGAGAAFSGLALDVGQKRGPMRLPAGQST